MILNHFGLRTVNFALLSYLLSSLTVSEDRVNLHEILSIKLFFLNVME